MNFSSEGDIGQLYGTIWNGDANYIVNDLKAFLRGKTEVTIQLHTPGGSVFDGNLIYNTLSQSNVKINMVIVGLAGSMGSILMLAGNTVSIASNAYVMTHAPSGVVDGNAKSMQKASKLLASLEQQFITKYAAKSGKPEEEVKDWLDGDNWFSAQEALDAGLVDSITDSIIDIDLSAMQEMSFTALSSSFDKEFIVEKKNSNNQNNDSMKLSAKSKEILGVTDDATDEQINASVEKLSKDNAELKAQADRDKNARKRALIDPAVADGRIPKAEIPDWEALADANFPLAESSIGKLQPKGSLPIVPGSKSEGIPDARKNWTFTDWSKNDTKGLLKMKVENPEGYSALAEKAGIKL